MELTIISTARGIEAYFDNIGPKVTDLMRERFAPIAAKMGNDARSRAAAHIRYQGKRPGEYVKSIQFGVSSKRPGRVVGYVRSGDPLAHLMEYGFTISDMMIHAKSGYVMQFGPDVAAVFRSAVHRHATTVQPYPAMIPAFEARRAEIMAMFTGIAADAGRR